MRYSALLFFLILVTACEPQKSDKEVNTSKTYGATFDPLQAKTISELDKLFMDKDSVSIALVSEIEKTCAVKGCWMQLRNGQNNSLRVTFKDYAFFVPKNGMEGKKATIQGYCVKQVTSVEELKHYAEDAGESEEIIAAITSPKLEYNFVASGVIIED